jgi:hypothetical protein
MSIYTVYIYFQLYCIILYDLLKYIFYLYLLYKIIIFVYFFYCIYLFKDNRILKKVNTFF